MYPCVTPEPEPEPEPEPLMRLLDPRYRFGVLLCFGQVTSDRNTYLIQNFFHVNIQFKITILTLDQLTSRKGRNIFPYPPLRILVGSELLMR